MTQEETDQRNNVVDVARSFIGTPYQSNASIKGVGVDCGTLLTMTFVEADLRDPIYLGAYSPQFHMASNVPLYEGELIKNGAHEVDTPNVGDIALYFQGRQFAHGAIVTQVDPTLRIIHAYAPSRCVVEGDETEFGLIVDQPKKFFSAW